MFLLLQRNRTSSVETCDGISQTIGEGNVEFALKGQRSVSFSMHTHSFKEHSTSLCTLLSESNLRFEDNHNFKGYYVKVKNVDFINTSDLED